MSTKETGAAGAVEMSADRKLCHMAHLQTGDGRVSAWCFKRPRAINLRVARWTIRWSAVTCRKCLRKGPIPKFTRNISPEEQGGER